MSPVAARKMVLVSVLGLLVVATYKGKSGVPTSTRLWGTGWLAIMLGVTADFAPQIAGPFALLVLAGSLTNGGDKALVNLLEKSGAGAPAGDGKSKSKPDLTGPPPGTRGPIGNP